MNIRTILVEDEPLARQGLQSYIHEVPMLELVGICENAIEANQLLSSKTPDLMLLDIQMPKITGLDFLKSIQRPPLVILTTAYPNYALQGFELNVVDYLVKPYGFDRFLKAINKVSDLLQLKNQSANKDNSKDFLYIKVDSV